MNIEKAKQRWKSMPKCAIDVLKIGTMEDWISKTKLQIPCMVPDTETLGITVPPELTIQAIEKAIGREFRIQVIDVAEQTELSNWTLKKWTNYFTTPSTERSQVLNLISLEFSQTKFAQIVHPPAFVDKIGLVETLWPTSHRKTDQFPRVQKYCLMSAKDSYTDFHIDFGGSSVWYHVYQGKKIFYLIPPTEENLIKYDLWTRSYSLNRDLFFGDLIPSCQYIEVVAGQNIILPSGWIHAVYTTEDSIAFGGNFLHRYSIPMQICCYHMEIRMIDMESKFLFPKFMTIMWLLAIDYIKKLKSITSETGENEEDSTDYDNIDDMEHVLVLINALSLWNKEYSQSAHSNNSSIECDKHKLFYQNNKQVVAAVIEKQGYKSCDDIIRELKLLYSPIWENLVKKNTSNSVNNTCSGNDNDSDSEFSAKASIGYNAENSSVNEAKTLASEFEMDLAYPELLSGVKVYENLRMARLKHFNYSDFLNPVKYYKFSNEKPTHNKSKHKHNKAVLQQKSEETWYFDCSCGAQGENYNDDQAMIECDQCFKWQHLLCSGMPAVDNQEHQPYICFHCVKRNKKKSKQSQNDKIKIVSADDWIVDCACGIQSKNYDDGRRMIECEKCRTWQHTICIGIINDEDIMDPYICSKCQQLPKRKHSKTGSTISTPRKNGKKKSPKYRNIKVATNVKIKNIGQKMGEFSSAVDVSPNLICSEVSNSVERSNPPTPTPSPPRTPSDFISPPITPPPPPLSASNSPPTTTNSPPSSASSSSSFSSSSSSSHQPKLPKAIQLHVASNASPPPSLENNTLIPSLSSDSSTNSTVKRRGRRHKLTKSNKEAIPEQTNQSKLQIIIPPPPAAALPEASPKAGFIKGRLTPLSSAHDDLLLPCSIDSTTSCKKRIRTHSGGIIKNPTANGESSSGSFNTCAKKKRKDSSVRDRLKKKLKMKPQFGLY